MASILGSVLRTQSAKKVADAERKAQSETRRRNELDRTDQIARAERALGSTGNALLPRYFEEGENSFERQLAGDVRGMYDATDALYGSTAGRLNRYAEIAGRARPAMDRNQALADALSSGELLRDQLGEAEPVFAARTALAGAQKNSFLEAITKTMGETKAILNRQGFSGGGSLENNLMLGAHREGARAGSLAQGAAALQNAQERAAIQQGNRAYRLGNTGLPGTVAAQALALEQAPEQALTQSYQARTAPLNFFKMGYTPPPNIVARVPKKANMPESALWLNAGAQAADSVAEMASSAASMGSGEGGAPKTNTFNGASGLSESQINTGMGILGGG